MAAGPGSAPLGSGELTGSDQWPGYPAPVVGPGGSKGRRDLVAMLTGTLLVGLSGYLFLALIGHGRFDAATTAALSAVYLLGNILGPGVFFAVEQESSRVIADAISRGLANLPRIRRLQLVDGALMVATLLLLAALTPLLLDRVLNDELGLLVALAMAVIGSAGVYLIRGLTGGQLRFRRYASSVLLDGGVRIAGCVLLVALGNGQPVAWALALCAGPGVAAVLTARRSAPRDGPTIDAPPPLIWQLARDVGWLLVASALWMIMANVAPVVVTAMLVDHPVTAAGFAAAVVLTRVPLLLMGPIQAMLLPQLTAAVAADDRALLRATILRGLLLIAGIGVVAVIGTALVGRPVIGLLFGADRDTTDEWQLVWLTASAAVFMAVLMLQPALVALRLHRVLVAAWVAGAVAFAASFALPLPPVDDAIVAQLVGPLITLTVQLVVLRSRARSTGRLGAQAAPAVPDPGIS
jgi:O-antigen/teichoic acid export membrane protein